MIRPLRLEFAGALYHITSRCNGRNLIYLHDDDFELFLQILANVCERYKHRGRARPQSHSLKIV
jgi:putative transposase